MTVFAYSNFQTGDAGAFASTTNVDFPNDPTAIRLGKVARMHYADGAGLDTNEHINYQLSLGSEIKTGSLWTRAWIYTPSPQLTLVIRKIIYCFQRDGTDKVTSGLVINGNDLRWFGGNTATNGTQLEYSTGYTWPFDQWVLVELETVMGTVGNPDSRARVYINGSLFWENNTSTQPITLRSDTNDNLGYIEVGEQFRRLSGSAAYDEYRYFDNVAISDARFVETSSPVTVLANGSSTANPQTQISTIAISPQANTLLVFFAWVRGQPTANPTMAGGGLSWTVEKVENDAQGVATLFMCKAYGSPPADSVFTFTRAGTDTWFQSCYAMLEIIGASPTANIIQKPSSSAETATDPYVINYPLTFLTNNFGIACFVIRGGNYGSTPRTGWTELIEFGIPAGVAQMALHYRPDADTAASANYGGAAGTQIKYAAAAEIGVPVIIPTTGKTAQRRGRRKTIA